MRDSLVPLLDCHRVEFSGPFQWGVRDCVTFTASWVKRVTGRDLIPDSIVWSDKESAMAALASLGCADTRELASRFLAQCPLLSARVGDIVGRDMPGGFTLGVCVGADVRFLLLNRGIATFALSSCHAAWAVEPCLQ